VDRKSNYLDEVVKPLTDRTEDVYVVAGSDAEAHVKKRFPHKKLRVIQSSLRPINAKSFFDAIPLTFQKGPAKGLVATFHFELSADRAEDAVAATVRIDDGKLSVEHGLVGTADVRIRTAGTLWIDIVNKRRNPVWAVLRGKLSIAGDRKLLDRFEACFPR
jgi:putative sterol carrier protein